MAVLVFWVLVVVVVVGEGGGGESMARTYSEQGFGLMYWNVFIVLKK